MPNRSLINLPSVNINTNGNNPNGGFNLLPGIGNVNYNDYSNRNKETTLAESQFKDRLDELRKKQEEEKKKAVEMEKLKEDDVVLKSMTKKRILFQARAVVPENEVEILNETVYYVEWVPNLYYFKKHMNVHT